MPAPISRIRLLTSVLFDAACLLAWLAIQRGFEWVAQQIGPTSDIEWHIAKWLFTIGTLGLIVMFVYWDLRSAVVVFKREFDKHRAGAQAVTGAAQPAQAAAPVEQTATERGA